MKSEETGEILRQKTRYLNEMVIRLKTDPTGIFADMINTDIPLEWEDDETLIRFGKEYKEYCRAWNRFAEICIDAGYGVDYLQQMLMTIVVLYVTWSNRKSEHKPEARRIAYEISREMAPVIRKGIGPDPVKCLYEAFLKGRKYKDCCEVANVITTLMKHMGRVSVNPDLNDPYGRKVLTCVFGECVRSSDENIRDLVEFIEQTDSITGIDQFNVEWIRQRLMDECSEKADQPNNMDDEKADRRNEIEDEEADQPNEMEEAYMDIMNSLFSTGSVELLEVSLRKGLVIPELYEALMIRSVRERPEFVPCIVAYCSAI